MGLFKWYVKLGDYGEFIADGWVKATSNESAASKVRRHYINYNYNIIIEDNYDFFDDEDLMSGLDSYHVFDDDVVVRWEN